MSTTMEQGRVTTREFVQRVARRGGLSPKVARQAYDAMIDELKDLVGQGFKVTFTGFGKFYPQEHKGHRVHFGDGKQVEDYTVMRFSATRETNKGLKVKKPD